MFNVGDKVKVLDTYNGTMKDNPYNLVGMTLVVAEVAQSRLGGPMYWAENPNAKDGKEAFYTEDWFYDNELEAVDG